LRSRDRVAEPPVQPAPVRYAARVPLDRRTIEKKDFPTARQGYDKAAVDAHLSAIADEYERAGRADTIAGSASERVRAIVEAAETSAALIEREAQEAAMATRANAEQFGRDARAGAGQIAEIVAGLAEQLEHARSRLEDLVAALSGTATPLPPLAATPAEPAASTTEPEPEPAPPAEPKPAQPTERPPEDRAAPPDAGVTEGARLIALDMALSGSSRDETAKYLDENFNLPDRDRVLDEVYAKLAD